MAFFIWELKIYKENSKQLIKEQIKTYFKIKYQCKPQKGSKVYNSYQLDVKKVIKRDNAKNNWEKWKLH